MGRSPIGKRPMTAAERQQKRRSRLRERRRVLKCENCGRKATLKCRNCGYEPTKDEMIAMIITLRQENAELWREFQLLFDDHLALMAAAGHSGRDEKRT